MESSISVTEQFLDKYKQLESAIHQQYGNKVKEGNDAAIAFIENKPEYRIYKDGLKWCREIRNLLSHKPKVREAYPIEPSQQMIDFMDEVIIKVRNRKTCMHVGVPFAKMYCRSLEDTVMETITEMRDKAFTYVPIIEEEKVIGIFDENALFCYVADNGIVDLDGLTFDSIKKYIGLNGREMEVFTFHNRRTYVEELQEEFQRQFYKNKRIGVAFITENGKRSEAVTHMLTAWDIIGYRE